jgi:galactokinase
MTPQQLRSLFVQHFQQQPTSMIRSPGRVNIIGEHTDYNEGFVLPMALTCATWLAIYPRDDRRIVMRSDNVHENIVLDLQDLQRPQQNVQWQDYVAGVAHMLQEAQGHALKGFDAVVIGDVPMGAGLSSSASFELAVAKALSEVNRLNWDPTQMALLCQKAENHWVGVNCGIMDQLICAAAVQGRACMIDCRDLSVTPVPLPEHTTIVIMDTMTRRGLADSAYNERRNQCEQVAKQLGVKFLRDVDLETLCQHQASLDPLAYRRAHHVVSENARVLEAVGAMRANDAIALGHLMVDSHHSMNQDFEITNDQLNIMVNIALSTPGCFGARMTGGGFGGCAVALVANDQVVAFIDGVAQQYEQQAQLKPAIYISKPMSGCSVV